MLSFYTWKTPLRNFHIALPVLLSLGLAVGSANLFAEDIATKASREHEQRLQEEQQRLQEKIRNERPASDVFLQQPVVDSNQPVLADTACTNVSLIAVQGVAVLDMELVDGVTKPYLNRCLNLSAINQLIKEISDLYLSRGYITTRAFIQPQRLKQGTLDVLVIEGKLEKLSSADDNLSSRQMGWAFPVEEGKILNLRNLEQGIEQLNRLQQNHAELNIKPGAETGDSLVDITNTKGSALHGSASLDNSGSEATGKNLAGLSLSWDNPLHLNDNLYLTLSDALGGGSDAKSRSYSANYSIPYGYALVNFSASYFEYQQLVEGSAVNFLSSGRSANESLGMDYVVYRGQHDKLLLTANFTHKDTKNYLEDVFLETSSRSLYLADLGATYTYKLNGGFLHSSFKWYQSLNVLDAKTKLSAAEQSYQFNKYVADLSLSKQFVLLGKEFLYVGSAQYLYSPDDLLASEGLAIGGRYTVRGIEGEGLAGNKGGYIRNEISYDTHLLARSRIEPFLGLDVGQVSSPEYQHKSYALTGAFFGVRYASENVSADCTYARAISLPEFINADNSGIYFNLRFSI